MCDRLKRLLPDASFHGVDKTLTYYEPDTQMRVHSEQIYGIYRKIP